MSRAALALAVMVLTGCASTSHRPALVLGPGDFEIVPPKPTFEDLCESVYWPDRDGIASCGVTL